MKTAAVLIGNDLVNHTSDTLDIITDLELFEDEGYDRYLIFNNIADSKTGVSTLYYGNRKYVTYPTKMGVVNVIVLIIRKMDAGEKLPKVIELM